MSDTELAWAAGFFDGEGSIGSRVDKRYGRRVGLDMTVGQSSDDDSAPPSLLRFKEAVGGVGQIHKRKPSKSRFGTRPMWFWRSGKVSDVKDVVALLLPHMTVKVDQAAEAIALRNEYEGLLADRKRICKRGHDLMETAYPNNLHRSNCRECNRERVAEWRLSQKGGSGR